MIYDSDFHPSITSLGFLHQILWRNAGFGIFRKIPELDEYEPRFDPTVIPISSVPAEPSDKVNAVSDSGSSPPVQNQDYYSVADYHSLYNSGDITPNDVIRALLPLIRRTPSPPGKYSVAWLENNVEVILAAAEASTLRYKEKKPLGVLDGVPLAVKDEIDVDGYQTRRGSTINYAPPSVRGKSITAHCVLQWEKAGAINVGKLNQHEFGMGQYYYPMKLLTTLYLLIMMSDVNGNNSNWGTPSNPHNDQYYPGGSSSGSAYAVSAGLVPITLGTDAGGSIRVPSSFCGVYGLKTSHGRISANPMDAYFSTNLVIGPLAADLTSLEAAYRIMATPDPSSRDSSLFPPPQKHVGPRSKVIGTERTWFDRADDPIRKLCYRAVEYYEKTLGYTIVDIQIPFLPEGQLAHAVTVLTEAAGTVSDHIHLSPANRILLAVGRATPGRDYILAQRMRNLLMRHLGALFQEYPGLIVVTPTIPSAGWLIEGEDAISKEGFSDGNQSVRVMEYIWLANFTGCPAMTFPVGYIDPSKGEGSLPAGLMGMGEWGSEDLLIEWGRDGEKWLNRDDGSGRKRPQVWIDVLNETVPMSSTEV